MVYLLLLNNGDTTLITIWNDDIQCTLDIKVIPKYIAHQNLFIVIKAV